MSFGGSKNPPWQRNSIANNAGQQITNMQAQMGIMNPQIVGFSQNQQYNQNMSIQPQQQQQQSMSIMSQMGGNLQNQMPHNQLFTQAVTYPAPRALNPIAFSNNANQLPPQMTHHQQSQQTSQINHQMQSNQGNQNNSPAVSQSQSNLHSNLQANLSKNIRVFSGTGFVTKLQNDFGFIDEEVYFHKNVCVKGIVPKIGDRVLLEANYNPGMPFKWNASRIQLLTPAPNVQRNYPTTMNSGNSGYNAVPPPNLSNDNNYNRSNRTRNLSPPIRRASPDRYQKSKDSRRDSDVEENDRKRRREERDKDRDRFRDRRDHTPDRRERSPVRRSSPKRRKTRVVPRYMVQIPKLNLTSCDADILEIRRRYSYLYVPSDFFFTQISWVDAFPPNKPFSINKPCSFHIMLKDVETPENYDQFGDPPDADYIFSAKVMLMSVPQMSDIYDKCFATAEEKDRSDDRDFVHPTRLINFLVGIRGKNETMAIGGPWSKSLDGDSPELNTSVLIKTAIRNCKALTGIDLSSCTQWYRFVELYYRRSETIHKGRVIPARIETVVIFLPDVRSCIPTLIEWDGIQNRYKRTLDIALSKGSPVDNDKNTVDSAGDAVAAGDSSITTIIKTESTINSASTTTAVTTKAPTQNSNIAAGSGVAAVAENDDDGNSIGIEKEDIEGANIKTEPTHFSDLDPKTMKLIDLRNELVARNLSAKGLKAQLIARLSKALKIESNSPSKEGDGEQANSNSNENDEEIVAPEETPEPDMDLSCMVVIDEYDSTKNRERELKRKKPDTRVHDDKERQLIEKHYVLPSTPHIIVHPSKTAKSGKFDCTLMSLSLLLDYRSQDTKEHSFEVSLFAELFNEMLMRDFGFNIYRALYWLPDKIKEEPTRIEDDKTLLKTDNEDGDEKEKQMESTNVPSTSDKANVDKIEKNDTKHNDKDTRKSISRDKERDASDQDMKRLRNRDDENSDNDNNSIKSMGKKKPRDRDRHKYFTANLDLLLSFVYFDQSHCGYIFEKDIEDLFYTLGLNLSRAQTRRLVGKVVSRDSLYYRKLTDLPKEDEKKESPSADAENEEIMEQMAKGNKYYLPIFKTSNSLGILDTPNANSIETDDKTPELIKTTTSVVPDSLENVNNNLITYKGAIIDVQNLLDQMGRSEQARENTESILVDLRKQNQELNTNFTKIQSKLKDLQSDLKTTTRKLADAESNLSVSNRKISDYHSIITSINDKIAPVVGKNEKNSTRSDTNRDSKDTKERDSSKDKERDRQRDSADSKVGINDAIKKERSDK